MPIAAASTKPMRSRGMLLVAFCSTYDSGTPANTPNSAENAEENGYSSE